MAETGGTVAGRRLGDLARLRPDWRLHGDGATIVDDIDYDSRRIRQGQLFAALPGGYVDGHDYLAGAVGRGAVAVLVEREAPVAVPQIVVSDTRAALPIVAAALFDHPSEALGVIGVTGTDGKTSTCYVVDHILRHAERRTGMIGTVAVRIGDEVIEHDARQTTPESSDMQRLLRRMADAGATWATVEATSHGLDLHRLDETRFRIGAVTNITHEHLEHHKTIAAYRRAKAILFERVAEANGVAVVNLDDEGAREMLPYAAGAQVLTYGMDDQRADVTASNVRFSAAGAIFDLNHDGRSLLVSSPLIGAFNVSNQLCAVGVALAAGVSLEQAAEALATAASAPGRLQAIDRGQPFGVVVDYAHTPESLEKVLRLLREQANGGRVLAVFGSGGERDTLKRPLQGAVSARLADVTIVTSEDPRFEDPEAIVAEIAAGARAEGATDGERLFTVVERRDALRLVMSLARPGDVVLLAGKGHEGSIIWGGEKRPWDEAAEARAALAERGWSA